MDPFLKEERMTNYYKYLKQNIYYFLLLINGSYGPIKQKQLKASFPQGKEKWGWEGSGGEKRKCSPWKALPVLAPVSQLRFYLLKENSVPHHRHLKLPPLPSLFSVSFPWFIFKNKYLTFPQSATWDFMFKYIYPISHLIFITLVCSHH